MAEGLLFDDEVNHALKMAYQTPDIVAARAEVINALDIQVGQKVLDIGSGPGLLARDIAKRLGETGVMLGVDMADNMIESAQKLCIDMPWVSFEQCDAMSLPYPDNSFDAVVSTQVYEYVPDLNSALAEFGRVLRPGGRGVIVDTDWAFPYWNATDTSIRGRLIEAWKAHCAQESVPLRLPAAINFAGLQQTNVQALPIINTVYAESSFSYWLSKIIASFVLGRSGVKIADTNSWIEGLEDLDRKGEYLFCINRYLFEITK